MAFTTIVFINNLVFHIKIFEFDLNKIDSIVEHKETDTQQKGPLIKKASARNFDENCHLLHQNKYLNTYLVNSLILSLWIKEFKVFTTYWIKPYFHFQIKLV